MIAALLGGYYLHATFTFDPSAAEMLLEVIILTLLYELRGSLGPENLSDIPNWTAYT